MVSTRTAPTDTTKITFPIISWVPGVGRQFDPWDWMQEMKRAIGEGSR